MDDLVERLREGDDLHSRIEAAARIEALEALVIQYRDDLRHPVTDQDSIDRRLAAISAVFSVNGGADE